MNQWNEPLCKLLQPISQQDPCRLCCDLCSAGADQSLCTALDTWQPWRVAPQVSSQPTSQALTRARLGPGHMPCRLYLWLLNALRHRFAFTCCWG
eukprot:6177819-Pleurochrysis_carterae.AAC.2